MRIYKLSALSAIVLLLVNGIVLPQTLSEVRSGFAKPPAETRIMMRWWWFGPSVTKEEIERELRVMRDGGIGGVEVQPVYPLLPDDAVPGHKNLPYLSDEFLEMLRFASEKARELGMRFDLTLGSGWSFGGAKTPITQAAGQLRVERVKVKAGETRVPIPSMIGAEHFLAAFLSKASGNVVSESDLTELSDIRDGVVRLPEGTAGEVLFFIGGKSGMQVKRPAVGAEGYVLNHLDRTSVEEYLKNTGDRLFTAFDKDTVPYSVFCDSLEVYNQDWTDGFLEEFRKRRGYDLKPNLPALLLNVQGSENIRYDWGRTITELFNERFMVPMQQWSKRNGTRFRIQGYGIPPAAISSNKWADISDGEGAQWKVVRAARWASSANHIFGRNVTSSETWTWLHSPVFRATPLDLKAEADIHFLQGINQLIGHGWAYTPPYVEYPGWRFYAAGEYSDRNPWWIVMPDLAAYLQRMSYLMRQGKPVNDVALYLPNADAYSHFTPGRVHLIDAERELVGEKVMPSIFNSGFNLDFFDDPILNDVGAVTGRELVLGEGRYRAIVLPGIERIPLESMRKIEQFAKAGGVVVASRRVPSKVPGMSATAADKEELKRIVDRTFGGAYPSAKMVGSDEETGPALAALLTPDVLIGPAADGFGAVHRRTSDADVYFVANTSNQKRRANVTLRANGGRVELLDAMTGRSTAVAAHSASTGRMVVDLDFEPYQSYVVVISAGPPVPTVAMRPAADEVTDISSGWTVAFNGSKPTLIDSFRSWTDDDEHRFYSGTAEYSRTVNIPNGYRAGSGTTVLDLGDAKPIEEQFLRNGMQTWLEPPVKEAAVVYVNGQRAGSVWCPPYRIEIGRFLRPGPNEVRIAVANTAVNYMAGRRLPDYKLLNLRYGERFQPQDMDKVAPVEAGLTGPIRLVRSK